MSSNPDTGPGRSTSDKARAATNEAVEEIKLAGNQLVDRVRDLIEEGNVRRIIVKKDQKTLLEVPVTVAAGAGAAVVLISPVLAALGALAALLTDVTLVVERDPEASSTGQPTKAPASKPVTDKGGGKDTDKSIGR